MADVVAVVDDLYFQSRVRSAAPREVRVTFLTSAHAASEVSAFSLALVDLDVRFDAIEVIRQFKGTSNAPVIAFGPHLDTEKRKRAKIAGADRVLAKSKFVTELPILMRNLSDSTPLPPES